MNPLNFEWTVMCIGDSKLYQPAHFWGCGPGACIDSPYRIGHCSLLASKL